MELGKSLWHEDEPEGGTKPFGSICSKGLEPMFLIFFFFLSSSLFIECGFMFFTLNTSNRFLACRGALPWIGLDKEGEGKEKMRRKQKKRNAHKPKLPLIPMRALVLVVMHLY